MEDFWIQKLLTKRGLDLKYELLGQIRNPVNPVEPLPKSLQSTRTFAEFTNDKQKIKTALMEHLSHLCSKLRRDNLKAKELVVLLKEKNFTYHSQKNLFKQMFNSEFEVQKEMFKMFDDLWEKNVIYRSCGVCVLGIKSLDGEQLGLFDTNENKKFENLSKTMDKIEEKFGKGSVKIGRI